MANADGSVVIEFDADVSDANKKIGRLKTEIQNLKTKISEKEFKHNSIVEQADAMRSSIKKAEAEVDAFRKSWLENQTPESEDKYNRSVEKLEQMNVKYKEIVASADKLAASIEEDKNNLEAMRYAGGQLQAEVNAAEQAAAQQVDTSAAEQAESKMESIFARMKATASEVANSIKLGLTGIAGGFASMATKIGAAAWSALKSISSLIKNGLKQLMTYAGNAAKSFLSLFSRSKQLNGSFASGIKTMLKYSLGIRSLYVLFNKMRTALTDGFKNLAQFSDSTNKSISMMQSALTQLKNSLATAFAPILTVVAPILTRFINMLSTAADYVARLTAALTGKKTYTKAVAVQEDYAKSLEGTADAADEAAGSLAGFDEITTITTEDASKGAGGGADVSDMFEEVAIEPLAFDSWGEAFSAFLDKILNNGIPRLKEGLAAFANWLNKLSVNLYEMFTFPGVYDKVAALGAELAYALNDFVNQIDWATLGGALGAGINLLLGFLVSFIYNFDWLNFGASLATMINNAIAEIDWYNVGRLLWAKFKIALETLAGFIGNLDMPELAKAASDMAIGFFNSITETIKNIDWKKIADQIEAFLVNVDWAGVTKAVFEAIGYAISAVLFVLWDFILDAWNQIVEWWNEHAYEDGKFTIQGLLDGIWDAIKYVGKWLWDNVVQPMIDAFCDLFGIHSPSTVMEELGGYIMDGLLNGLGKKVQEVKDLFSDLWDDIKEWWNRNVSKYFTLDYWKGLGEDMIDGLRKGLNGIFDDISTWASNVWNRITGAFSKKNATASVENSTSSGVSRMAIPNMPSIASYSIPALASGAVIPPNREFMAVLGDNKRETEIVSPLSTMKQAMLEALKEAGGAGGEINITVESVLDGKVVARNTVKHINAMTQQAGKPVLLF